MEAAGLAWLTAAPGGAPVAEVLHVGPGRIELAELEMASPAAGSAHLLGAALARTHAAGGRWFGAPAPGWHADGFIGPLPLPHAQCDTGAGFEEFFAELRLRPFLRRCRDAGAFAGSDVALVEAVLDRLLAGRFEVPPEPAARLHGDLWTGNVVWTPGGAVLVDPAAHGGHRESDLAMLALFGAPELDAVLAGYQQVAPLAQGWRQRVPLHQLHPLLVHTALFGGGYGDRVLDVCRGLS